jgi:rod shape-determining protein MreD
MINKIIKSLIMFFVLYYLLIFEMSFFTFFTFLSFSIILVFLINIIEEPKERLGIFLSFFLGLIIDIYSSNYLGTAAISFLIISLVLKFILFRYVRIPSISSMPKI